MKENINKTTIITTPNGNRMSIKEYLDILRRENIISSWQKTENEKEFIIKFN
jgi:hypothetical protein